MSKGHPFPLFSLPWPEFRDRIEEVCLLTGCYPIGPLPEANDRPEWNRHRRCQYELYSYRVDFEAGSKIAGIEAFLFLHKSGYSFPNWLTGWLYDALYEFHRTEGKSRDLTKLLKMETKQKIGNEFKIERAKDGNAHICYEMIKLQALTEAGVTKCSEVLRFAMPKGQSIAARTIANIFDENKTIYECEFNWTAELKEFVQNSLEDVFDEYNDAMQAAAEDPTCSFSFDDLRRPLRKMIEKA